MHILMCQKPKKKKKKRRDYYLFKFFDQEFHLQGAGLVVHDAGAYCMTMRPPEYWVCIYDFTLSNTSMLY
jgi:hypothetical protein